jgi:hypothetical protein
MVDLSVTGRHGHCQLESSNNGEDKEETHPSLLDVIPGISEYKVKGMALGRQLVFISFVHLPALRILLHTDSICNASRLPANLRIDLLRAPTFYWHRGY